MTGVSVHYTLEDYALNSMLWPEPRVQTLLRDHPLFATWLRNADKAQRQAEPKP